MGERLVLIGDCVEGTWDGVVQAWCEGTGEDQLTLVPSAQEATAYLIVAKHAFQALTALRRFTGGPQPVVWVDEFAGRVRRYPSLRAADRALRRECNP